MIRPRLFSGDVFVREFGDHVCVMPDPDVTVAVEVWTGAEPWLSAFQRMAEHLLRVVTLVLFLSEQYRWIVVYRNDAVPRQFEPTDTLMVPDLLPGFAVPVVSLFA